MKSLLLLALIAPLAACEGQGEGPNLPDNAMPVKIEAAKDVSYDFRCRFRTVTLPGSGQVNSINLSGEGARDGAIPTDNARCTLKQTGGTGPVTATITKGGAVAAKGTVSGPGAATAYLDVL
jgi:hypothetical protein